jgi:hypothetical protein
MQIDRTVCFSHSTLVSVCSASEHVNQSYRRFDLFSTKSTIRPLNSTGDFHVDLHTSLSPVIVCKCTPLKEIFSSTTDEGASNLPIHITLYAVKRKNEAITEPQEFAPTSRSKEQVYLADSAWQPSVPQTTRGMAALLSSLYTMVHSANQKGSGGETNILSFLYAITRFPPAVRARKFISLNTLYTYSITGTFSFHSL